MKIIKSILVVVSPIPVIIAGWIYLAELWAADKCLDQGGSYNYREMTCDFETSHTFVPFHHRHPGIYGSALIGGGAVVIVVIMSSKKRAGYE